MNQYALQILSDTICEYYVDVIVFVLFSITDWMILMYVLCKYDDTWCAIGMLLQTHGDEEEEDLRRRGGREAIERGLTQQACFVGL